jgi:alpha-beta hydrolase superfamily lysophospholipase
MPAHLGAQRPFGLGYWPLPDDDPSLRGSDVQKESVRIVTADRALVRGVLWLPPTGQPVKKTAIILSHPRGDFSVHYACPLLAARGYAVFGFATRYLNNDTDCLHELAVLDVVAAADEMRRRGYENVILFGNSGGGSLMALAEAHHHCGDAWVGVAAHPGEGMFMGKVIDPSVTDEGDSFSIDPSLDMYNPDNGWRPWPNSCTYDRDWLERYREAQLVRIARIDEVAKASIAVSVGASARLKQVVPDDLYTYRDLRARAVSAKYMVIYRTLADPAYLDLSIDPDERAMGSLFAFPDPLDANYGRGGLARTMTARAWLSTWSALSSKARLADTMPDVKKPTLILHPTADTEIRVKEALEIRDAAGASDLTYVEMKGALHYLEGDRPVAMDIVADWIDARFN